MRKEKCILKVSFLSEKDIYTFSHRVMAAAMSFLRRAVLESNIDLCRMQTHMERGEGTVR